MNTTTKITKSNVELYIEHINGSYCIEKIAKKYNFSISVMEAILEYGREEYRDSEYWNYYLKGIVERNNIITIN